LFSSPQINFILYLRCLHVFYTVPSSATVHPNDRGNGLIIARLFSVGAIPVPQGIIEAVLHAEVLAAHPFTFAINWMPTPLAIALPPEKLPVRCIATD